MSILSQSEIDDNIKELDGWSTDYKNISKEYIFENFVQAISFVLKVGFEAEKIDHHPDILLHSWNKVKIILSTHSENGVTKKDFDLAKRIKNLTK